MPTYFLYRSAIIRAMNATPPPGRRFALLVSKFGQGIAATPKSPDELAGLGISALDISPFPLPGSAKREGLAQLFSQKLDRDAVDEMIGRGWSYERSVSSIDNAGWNEYLEYAQETWADEFLNRANGYTDALPDQGNGWNGCGRPHVNFVWIEEEG